MKYSFRKSAVENEKEYYLTDDVILIKDLVSETTIKLPYKNIAEIRLKFIAKRSMPDAYLCEIISKKGAKVILVNQHFKDFASFENRSEAYNLFLQNLHSKIENEAITFSKGNNSVMNVISILLFAVFGLIALIMAFAALIPYGLFIIAIVIYLGFRLKKYYQKNKGGQYSPKQIPIELLP